MGSRSKRRRPCSAIRTPWTAGSASLEEGVTVPATGARGDGPRAHSGLYRQEARRWRKHPHHQRAPGEPEGAGGLCGGVQGLTSPTFRKLPQLGSERCDASGGRRLGAEARRLIAIRIDPQVLNAVRREAKRRGLGYQSLINELLAKHIGRVRSAY